MTPVEKKHIRLRVIIIGSIFSLFFTAIFAKAVYLQLFRGPWLSQKAATQYKVSCRSYGKRGTIYDTNLKELAISIDVTSITAHPPKIKNAQATAKLLSKVLKINRKSLVRKLASNKKFVWIKRKATPKETEAARNLKIAGIDFLTEHKRFYPNKMLAAQMLGFTDIDDRGLEGIEFYYNEYLQGVASKYTVLKDALGRSFDAEKTTGLNYSGNNLILTIDSVIEYITEKALEEAVTEFSAKSGIAIVMAPKTGAILALAHYPFFNPNAINDFSQEIWRNRIITDPFEPGSTMKIFAAAAAIESGSSSPNSIFYCENGAYKIGKHVIHDSHKHGWLSLQQIVKYSSNIGTVKFSAITGPKFLYKTLRDFGFGTKTGIDCPGETGGSMASYRRWTKIDAGTIAFGQGISVSSIQLITATSAIANKGVLMKPYIVQAITAQDGRLIKSFGPRRVRRVISEKAAQALVGIMKTVITKGGTGVNAALEGHSVCGKTGTAQKIDEKGKYAGDKYISSFVGFLPDNMSKAVILVVINEPEKQHYGSIVAAPAFKKIATKIIDYMNICPKSETGRLIVSLKEQARG